MMDRARVAILEGRFSEFRRDIKDLYPEKGGAPIDAEQRTRKREAGGRQAASASRGPNQRGRPNASSSAPEDTKQRRGSRGRGPSKGKRGGPPKGRSGPKKRGRKG